MSFNLQAYGRFDTRIYEDHLHGGSIELPHAIAVTGLQHRYDKSIGANTNAVIYNDELAGFNFLWIQSTRVLILLLTTSGTNTKSLKVEIPGSTDGLSYGAPFMLFSDDTYDADGVAARIAVVTGFNEDTTNAAVVKATVIQ